MEGSAMLVSIREKGRFINDGDKNQKEKEGLCKCK